MLKKLGLQNNWSVLIIFSTRGTSTGLPVCLTVETIGYVIIPLVLLTTCHAGFAIIIGINTSSERNKS
jgi:hypothetical protein